jgi:tetratricopeptide (TPR) repeat protein
MTARRLLPMTGGLAMAGALVAGVYLHGRGGSSAATVRPPMHLGTPLDTGPQALRSERQQLQAFVDANPAHVGAAARLAEVAQREARVTGNSGVVIDAETALRRALEVRSTYEGERVLAALLLSRHRFGEAAQIATRLSALEPRDAWLQGVLGDAALEQGDYEKAFAAFDTMSRLHPDASAYARVAYARELQGDLSGALQAMSMASSSTSPHDIEAQAWHAVQVAALHHQLGHASQARLETGRALHTFPEYPPALAMRATIQAAAGDLAAAAESLQAAVAAAPTAGWYAQLGDVQAARGQRLAAERAYARADAAWTTEMPEPREHALFLAMHGRDLTRAVTLAAQATRGSRDILSCEAHAWAAFRTGDLETARRRIDDALRTGSRLRRLRYHAAAIYDRLGDADAAREYLRVALASPTWTDLAEADAVAMLARDLGLAGANPTVLAGESGRTLEARGRSTHR